jgi:hypothetical protein
LQNHVILHWDGPNLKNLEVRPLGLLNYAPNFVAHGYKLKKIGAFTRIWVAPPHKDPQKIGCRPVLDAEYEEQLNNYAMKMSNLYHGITTQQLSKPAYDLAEANGIEHCFSKVTKVAGNDWFKGFMRRYL